MKTIVSAWVHIELAQALDDRAKELGHSRSTATAKALAAYCNRPDLATDTATARQEISARAEAFLKAHPQLSIRATVRELGKHGMPRGKSWVEYHRNRLRDSAVLALK